MLSDREQDVALVFIDSDHTYTGVALDYYSTDSIATKNAVFVFDDYSAASDYGIRRLINEELSEHYSVKIIDMELTAVHDISVDHMMALCNNEAADVWGEFTVPSDLWFKYLVARRRIRTRLASLKMQLKWR